MPEAALAGGPPGTDPGWEHSVYWEPVRICHQALDNGYQTKMWHPAPSTIHNTKIVQPCIKLHASEDADGMKL